MRKVILKMSVSVDGFVGGPNGDVDWVFPSLHDDATTWIVDTLWQAGVHIMGSVTYQDMAAYWPSSTESYATPMNEIPKVVFYKTLTKTAWTDSRVVNGDLAEEVARLKQQPGKDILAHGGARFAQSLSKVGLIDEYRLVIHPAVLGSGLPLFKDLPGAINLRLLSATTFSTGAVAHVYQPA